MKRGWLAVRALMGTALSIAGIVSVPGVCAGTQKTPKNGTAQKAVTTKPKPGALDPELADAIQAAPSAEKMPNQHYARLLDLGNVTVRADGTVVAEYRLTTKLFDENARDLAEVNLPYNASYQTLRVVRARTVKKDGTIVNVRPDEFRESAPYGEFLLYDDAKAVSFSMPAIENDCIIDYTWQEITRPMLMPGQFWLHWAFSGAEPSALSRYVLTTPADKKFTFKVYNDDTLKPAVTTSKDGRVRTYTWERRDLPPLELEAAMPSPNTLTLRMELSSIASWQDVAKWYWELQRPQAVASAAIKATVAKLIEGKSSDEEKARALYDWVANRTRYVGLEFGISAYKPHAAAEVHDKLYGDCKDKATLLITMLGLAGIKAHPALLAAGNREPVAPRLPTLDAFNHCIALAEVGGKEVWLDATAETCAFGDIPATNRGVEALVVRNGVGAFQTIPMYRPEENGQFSRTRVALHPDGSAEMDFELSAHGSAAQAIRARIRALTPDQRREMAQQLAQSSGGGGKLLDFSLDDPTRKDGPYTLKIKLTAPGYAKKAGSLLIIPINGGNAARRNPFTKDKRQWPIVEEENSRMRNEIVITLPDGFAWEEVPGDLNIVCAPLQTYRRTFAKSPDGRTLTLTEETTTTAGRLPPSDYDRVKTYNEAVLKSLDDQIVLKRATK